MINIVRFTQILDFVDVLKFLLQMSLCKLVTFDATNTLIRVISSVGQQYTHISGLYGVNADSQAMNVAFKNAWHQMNAEFPNYGSSQGMTSRQWWRRIVTQSLCSVCAKQKPTMSTIEQISDHLYLHFCTNKGWEVIPGTHEALSLLKEKGLKLAVISNYDERLSKVLLNLALIHYFDFIVVSAIEKVAKPDARIFHRALQLGSVNAAETIHVGDDATNDYFGARKAGLNSLLLCKAKDKIPSGVCSDVVIADLKEIANFV